MVLCVCCAYDRWPVCTKLIPGLGNAAHDLSFSWRIVGGFFLALLFYEVRPWQAVFASGAFFTLIALVEVLAMLLIGLRIPDTDILMQAGAARLVYVVFSNLIQVPLVVLISHFSVEREMLCASYGCCQLLRFKSQASLSVMWHSIMLRMSISRIIWSALWLCFSL